MITIKLLEIMSVLYFIASLRMRVWNTSLNSFVVICVFFVITTSYEFDALKKIWGSCHITILAVMLTFIMARVTYQSISSKRKKNGVEL